MFKNLREKIAVSENASKNNSGEQSLSRFSSISSLVSDVGSVFSKGQSKTNMKSFQDNESVSEYDDSIVQGEVINKDELFQRYQRAQSMARRYKTRSLEIAECYKKLEVENMKLTQTLTESQDCNIRRVAELREQLELDKKAKNDVEENYRLMFEENAELINVLRLQITLLKEGKDLPIELESQIKEKHELEVKKQKMKDDEIVKLKNIISERENLLLRCKERITHLNTQLKMKSENIENTSICGEDINDQFSSDLAKQRFQHVTALENLQKEHSERINIMLCDFEQRKIEIENEIHADFDKKCSNLKQELKDLKEQMNKMFEDNERLQEQVSIKTKIIEELIDDQDKLIIKEESILTAQNEHCLKESQAMVLQNECNITEHKEIYELKEENKFLLGRIDQMEALKLQTEEEISKIEEELKNVEFKLKKEKEDCESKCKSYELKLDQMKMELNYNASKTEELTTEIKNLNITLVKKNEEMNIIHEHNQESKVSYKTLEMNFKKTKEEWFEVMSKLEIICKEKEELEQHWKDLNNSYGSEKSKFYENEVKLRELLDQYDELKSSLEKEVHEKNKLLSLLNEDSKAMDSPLVNEDCLGLKVVEMRQRYDQQIEEGKEQISSLELILKDRNNNIQQLEMEMISLKQDNEHMMEKVTFAESRQDEFVKIKEDNKNYRKVIEKFEKETKLLSKDKDDYSKIIKENEELLNTLKKENEILQKKVENSAEELNEIVKEKNTIFIELEQTKVSLEEYRQKNLNCVIESENVQKSVIFKDEELLFLNEEKNKILSDFHLFKNTITQENENLKVHNGELQKEIKEFNEKLVVLEESKFQGNYLKEEIDRNKEGNILLQNKLNDVNNKYTSLQNETEELCKRNETYIIEMQKSLENVNGELVNVKQSKDVAERKMNVLLKFLCVFQEWIKESLIISVCGIDCNFGKFTDSSLWNSDLEEECENIIEILSFGKYVAEACSSLKVVHSHLHQLIDERSNSTREKYPDYGNFYRAVREICFQSEYEDNEISEDKVLQRLAEMCSDKDNISMQLTTIENTCKDLENMLINDDFTDDVALNDESSNLHKLKKVIVNKIINLEDKLRLYEEDKIKLQKEKDLFSKKYDKTINERSQHFKVLSNIFELSNIDFDQKSNSKAVMKGLKEYAQKHVNVTKDLSDAIIKYTEIERELNLSNEKYIAKENELVELRHTVEEYQSKLHVLRQELDKSVDRLNEFSDEKGRIDEEKQTMKKELHELNDKIQYLRQDIVKQHDEKEKLEKQFNESLEKVKANHLALEETYTKEIEKQNGYQCYLEKQIDVSREETTRKLTEKEHVCNIKLEEVLKQSEQLLVLNHQYKELLDKSNTETNSISANLKEVTNKYETIKSEVEICESEKGKLELEGQRLRNNYENILLEMKICEDEKEKLKLEGQNFRTDYEKILTELQICKDEKKKLSTNLNKLKENYQIIELERNNFKTDLDSLINDNHKSIETLVNLQSSNKSVENEKDKLLKNIKDLDLKNGTLEEELCKIKESLENTQRLYDDVREEKNNLMKELKELQSNFLQLKCDGDEKAKAIYTYKVQCETMQMKLNDEKEDHNKEIYEIKQQFENDKSNINDDHNYRVKKLAKEFNEKILDKEHEFQKTLQEVLENVRKEEARQKDHLKCEIDQLNRMVIELETEKNGLIMNVEDVESDIKKITSTLQQKDHQVQALQDEIFGYKSEINELESQLSKMISSVNNIEQRSKINQTVDVASCYENSSVDTVNANDHDVLQMHCADVEEQVRQLHLENIRLKQTIVENQSRSSMSPSHEHHISATKSQPLAAASGHVPLDNVSLKSFNIPMRSPMTSCSEYQFCPYPITDATEYEYLRDILVKYMTGLETNTLARVLCTVMKFSKDETNRVLRFEHDKKSILQIFPR